jgi:glycine/D-amino acid oxidase-like deaminating enzyme
MRASAEVVICGAGIAGIAAAYHLAQAGVRDVLLVEAGEPLALTSDKSTECYRNFWPGSGDGMARLMNRSLDLLDALALRSGNAFHLNRRGYLYCTADSARLDEFRREAGVSQSLGAGPVRIHPSHPSPYRVTGPDAPADGFDLLVEGALLRAHFPSLDERFVGALHVRRAGWMSAQQLGRLLLDEARAGGVRLLRGQVEAVATRAGRVESVHVATPEGMAHLSTPGFVNAAGPWLGRVARMLGVELPVYCELHAKVAIADTARTMPRNAPLIILSDPQSLDWSEEERSALFEDGRGSLLGEMPSGLHARPEGPDDSPILLALWPYHTPVEEPSFPLQTDAMYPEVVLRGLERLLPSARAYRHRLPRAFADGGYYTRTRENLPLIGPLGVSGAYVMGALSGFGVMAAMGAGELLAGHITQASLPEYSKWFLPTRDSDPAFQALRATLSGRGQL